jgi:peptidoglycan hydrolase-like protein with peptidoglycan-binding domain
LPAEVPPTLEVGLISPSRSLVSIAALAALAGLAGWLGAGVASANEVSQLAAGGAPEDAEIGDGPELDEGSLQDLVADAQRLLRSRGYDPGTIDGRLGWRTQRAIRAYQKMARSSGYLEALNGPGVAGPEPAAAAQHELVLLEGQPASPLQ